MASPLHNGKRSVDLKAPGVRGSRIRRNPPPPPVKQVSIAERDEINQRVVLVGVVAFAVALAVIIVGVMSVVGWSPAEYTVHL